MSKQIPALPAAAAAVADQLFEIVNDPSGVPTSQKLALSQILTLFSPLIMPAGSIIMWHGSIATIPSGWAFCNGANGTPDLRNRFIVSADADSGGVAKTTVISGGPVQIGGSNQHDHVVPGTVTDDADVFLEAGNQILDSSPVGNLNAQEASPGHNHSTSDVVANSTETVPPFFALAYIMKL